MLKILTITLLCSCVLGITTCDARLISTVEENNKATNRMLDSNQDCEEWTQTYSLLRDEGKKDLQREGIAVNGDDESAGNGYYVLSPELVNDCNLRVKIGQFIYLVVGGKETETERQFAKQNSEQIVKVLRHIWNAPVFSSDGTSHEKYLLLSNKGLKDEAVSPFIGELLKAEGLNSELIYVLITRPLTSLKPAVNELLKKSETEQD